MKRRWWIVSLVLGSAAGLLVLNACSTEDAGAAAGSDASTDSGAGGNSDGGTGSDSSTLDDAGKTKTVSFTVPSGGGSIDVQGNAMKMSFTFPASAAGKAITFTPGAPTDIGWPAGQFAEVIKMEPDGERFVDPIVVKPEKPALVSAVLSFSNSSSKSPASPVPLNADGSGFELRHFSTLVVVSAGRLCDSEGYNDVPGDPFCAGASGGRTSARTTTCKGYSYCLNVSVKCCVEPGRDGGGCTWADRPLQGTQTPTDSNGGQYPYCDGTAGDWDGGDSGCGNPKANYYFRNTVGCVVGRYECGNRYYEMSCDGGACGCVDQGPAPVPGATFAQGATCDHTAAMRTAFVQKCNYPVNQ